MKFATAFLTLASVATFVYATALPETTICVSRDKQCVSINGRFPPCCKGNCVLLNDDSGNGTWVFTDYSVIQPLTYPICIGFCTDY
jgi:hypothetical protein